MEEEEKIKQRKNKLKNWLKDPHNLALVGVILFAFIIRLHFFLMTKTQPLWWDELEYGTLAKNMIFHTWDGTANVIGETIIRPPLLPLLWSLLLRIGIGEVGTRFLLEFLPSLLAVLFVYLIGKELYNKRVALIGAFLLSILWIHLFYTMRIMTGVPAMALLFASVYYFIKTNKEEFNEKYFAISLALLSLATLTRYPIGILFLAYLFFLLIVWKFSILKKGKFWIYGIVGMIPMLIFFITNKINHGNLFPAFLDSANPTVLEGRTIAFWLLNFIPTYLKSAFFILFLLGTLIALVELFIGFDIIKKRNNLKAHLILLLIMIVFYAFFIFWQRNAEDRYFLPITISFVLLAGIGIDFVYLFIRKYSKQVAIIALGALLIFGAYQQITFADELIKSRSSSYLQMRQGFEWIRDNTPKDSVILGRAIDPYVAYYSEREYVLFPADDTTTDIEEMGRLIDELDADYMVLHGFRPMPAYINEYLSNNQDKWRPINAYFFDAEQQQPAFVLYQRIF
jgi:4-amino-4-deoxy-L-arabinose transferase-like glycosyltransferase